MLQLWKLKKRKTQFSAKSWACWRQKRRLLIVSIRFLQNLKTQKTIRGESSVKLCHSLKNKIDMRANQFSFQEIKMRMLIWMTAPRTPKCFKRKLERSWRRNCQSWRKFRRVFIMALQKKTIWWAPLILQKKLNLESKMICLIRSRCLNMIRRRFWRTKS